MFIKYNITKNQKTRIHDIGVKSIDHNFLIIKNYIY